MSKVQNTSYTSLRISKKLRDALMNMGKKSQSYEDIIWSLMPPESRPSPKSAGASEVARQIAKKAPSPTGKKRGGTKVPVKDEIKAEVRKLD